MRTKAEMSHHAPNTSCRCKQIQVTSANSYRYNATERFENLYEKQARVNCPGAILIHHSGEQATLLELRLGVGDLVDQEPHTALRDDIREAVAALDVQHGLCPWRALAVEPHEWDDIDDRVRQPADHGPPPGLPDEVPDASVRLLLAGLLEPEDQLLNNVAERDHGTGPVVPPFGNARAGEEKLTGVPNDDHQGGGDTEAPALGAALFRRQLHAEHDLDEQQRNRQEPVHVTVGVVERHAGQFGIGVSLRTEVGVLLARVGPGVLVGVNPAVEDTDVVVGGDEGHHAGDEHCALVLRHDRRHPQPQEQRGGHHGGQREGQDVVNGLVVRIAHLEHHHGYKGCAARWDEMGSENCSSEGPCLG